MAGDMMNRSTILVINYGELPSEWVPKYRFEYADLQGDLAGVVKRINPAGMIVKSDDTNALSDLLGSLSLPIVFVTMSNDVRADLALEETRVCVPPNLTETELVQAVNTVVR